MWTQNEYVNNQLNKDVYQRLKQEAENARLVKAAGLLRPNQITRTFCHWAGWLGRRLVSAGRLLEKVEKSAVRQSHAGSGFDLETVHKAS